MAYGAPKIITEITPLSDKDCFYLVDRIKEEFTYPIHRHEDFELNFVVNAHGARRVVGDFDKGDRRCRPGVGGEQHRACLGAGRVLFGPDKGDHGPVLAQSFRRGVSWKKPADTHSRDA